MWPMRSQMLRQPMRCIIHGQVSPELSLGMAVQTSKALRPRPADNWKWPLGGLPLRMAWTGRE